MKAINFFLSLLVLAISISGCSKPHIVAGEVEDINGEIIQLADYRGKWIVINYWASWCEPCAKEIPQLNAFYQAHQGKDAVVLGVNYDGLPMVDLKILVKKMGINYPILTADPKHLIGIEHVPGLPATYLISPEGKLVKSLFGEQTLTSLEKAMR